MNVARSACVRVARVSTVRSSAPLRSSMPSTVNSTMLGRSGALRRQAPQAFVAVAAGHVAPITVKQVPTLTLSDSAMGFLQVLTGNYDDGR